MTASRREQSLSIRVAAAQLAAARVHPRHLENGDEQKFRHTEHTTEDATEIGQPNYLASFTKGLPHETQLGLIQHPADFQQFVRGIDSGDPRDFRDTPLGHADNVRGDCHCRQWESYKAQHVPQGNGQYEEAKVRGWESAGAGLTFDLQGPDAQAVTMPPAPALGSAELTSEMAEVYVHALLRDVPFAAMAMGTGAAQADVDRVTELVDELNQLDWFRGEDLPGRLTPDETARRRGPFTHASAFRGITPGDEVGPYVSQFLLSGNPGVNGRDAERSRAAGLISYGAISIDQRVRYAKPRADHMTSWQEWIDVQNGADLRGLEEYCEAPPRRFITTPRDLATYVHYDALYEAYLNALLILLAEGIPFDPGIPFQQPDNLDHQQGFAHFGGPHILSLVTEVATRALKAVRFQKFNVHRRPRPELLAGRLHRANQLQSSAPELSQMHDALEPILDRIRTHNEQQNGHKPKPEHGPTELLPMAFCEGSPMHPAYGAGHATVAGACTTILKAFFDHKHPLALAETGQPGRAFVPASQGETGIRADGTSATAEHDGQYLKVVDVMTPAGANATLTVEGELNKLASNISIGRDWAGVHYFTDYIESIRMGEQIALGILEEQKLTYGENFSMTVPLFDGTSIRI